MTSHADPGADDLYLDRLLAQELGGERPGDRIERILHADAEERALAAARVDAAAAAAAGDELVVPVGRPQAVPSRPPRRAAAAALLVSVCGVLAWLLRPVPTIEVRAQAMIDAFHRVMPAEPAALRDPVRRAQLAPAAIPVLREVHAFFASLPGESSLGVRAPEFAIYAAVLGDTDALARAARPGADSDLLAATTLAITATDAGTRDTALARIAALLSSPPAVTPSAVHCLVTAGDLSVDEARRLAAASRDDGLAHRFRIAAELAASDPRLLLGQPFELSGRLRNGAEFSTTSLRGQVVLAMFWASWCAPCAQLLPRVVDIANRHTGQLAVVGISCDQDPAALQRFLAQHAEVDWPQLFDAGRPGWHELAFWSGVRAVPRVFLIDRRGILREVNARDGLEQLVDRLVAEPR